MNRYVIYTNENGTDSYLLKDDEYPEDKYKELLDENEDDYFLTSAICVEVENNKIVEQWSLGLPELEEN